MVLYFFFFFKVSELLYFVVTVLYSLSIKVFLLINFVVLLPARQNRALKDSPMVQIKGLYQLLPYFLYFERSSQVLTRNSWLGLFPVSFSASVSVIMFLKSYSDSSSIRLKISWSGQCCRKILYKLLRCCCLWVSLFSALTFGQLLANHFR